MSKLPNRWTVVLEAGDALAERLADTHTGLSAATCIDCRLVEAWERDRAILLEAREKRR